MRDFSDYKPLPADPVVTDIPQGGILSWTIRYGTTARNEKPSQVAHAALIAEPGETLESTTIVESTSPKVRMSTLGLYLEKSNVYIYRHKLLSHEDRLAIVALAKGRVDQIYGYGKLLWLGMDAVIGKAISLPYVLLGALLGRKWKGYEPRIFSRINLTDPLVCSQLVAWAYQWRLTNIGCDPRMQLYDEWPIYDPDSLKDEYDDHLYYHLVWTNDPVVINEPEGTVRADMDYGFVRAV